MANWRAACVIGVLGIVIVARPSAARQADPGNNSPSGSAALQATESATQAATQDAAQSSAQNSAQPAALTLGSTVKGIFTGNNGPFLYTFEANAGDMITLTMVADANQTLDPALAIIAPDGSTVAQSDDSLDPNFGMTNARLINFPIPAAGVYTIQAKRSTSDGGSFTMTLRGIRAKAPDIAINFGQTQQGKISDVNLKPSYKFQAAAGDVVTVTVQSVPNSKLVPYIVMQDADGNQLATSNPVAQSATGAQITNFPIQTDGTYNFIVSRVGEENGATTGAFSVMLSLNAHQPTITFNNIIQGTIDSSNPQIGYVFSAHEGDVISASLKRLQGNVNFALSLYDKDNDLISLDDGGFGEAPGNALIDHFQIPTAGAYVIMVGRKDSDPATSSGQYSLTLTLNGTETNK